MSWHKAEKRPLANAEGGDVAPLGQQGFARSQGLAARTAGTHLTTVSAQCSSTTDLETYSYSLLNATSEMCVLTHAKDKAQPLELEAEAKARVVG